MGLLISSFWRAVLYCLHPKVILLSLLPLLLAMGAAGLLAYLFWQSAQDALLAVLDASVFVSTLAAWLAAVGLPALKAMLAPLILIVVLTPLVVVCTVLLVSTLMTPALVRVVAERRFPTLERRHGASFVASVGWTLISCALALVATIVTSPMWILPPLVLVLPPAIWPGSLTASWRLMRSLTMPAAPSGKRFWRPTNLRSSLWVLSWVSWALRPASCGPWA